MAIFSTILTDTEFVRDNMLTISIEEGKTMMPTDEQANAVLAMMLWFFFKMRIPATRDNAKEYIRLIVKSRNN